MRRLIVSGDDLGLHPGINAGVVRCHREGIVTSASLCTNGGAFEDAVALDELMHAHPEPRDAFAAFEAERRPNATAIQDMALENYIEMRDLVDDPDFLLKKQVERALAERNPDRFVPRYGMVMFRRLPYALAQARGVVQWRILGELTHGRARLDEVELARGDALVRERLAPL